MVAQNLWNPTAPGGIGGLLERTVGAKQYYHYDHIGNPVQTVNANGEVTDNLFYSPFGELISGTVDHNQPFGHSTKRGDFKSGLLYFGYRFYVPHMERWLNRDPIGTDGGLNIYAYVEGNPIMYIDPTGLACFIRDDEGFVKCIDQVDVIFPNIDILGDEISCKGGGNLSACARDQESVRAIGYGVCMIIHTSIGSCKKPDRDKKCHMGK